MPNITTNHAITYTNKHCCKSETDTVYFPSRLISVPPLAGINISHHVESTSDEG